MKTIVNFLLLCCMFCLISCSYTQKFSIYGEPGTTIYTPNGAQVAVIDQTGKTKMKSKRKNGYMPYLLSKAPNSDVAVPFALDYKDHKKRFTDVCMYALAGIFAGGGAVAVLAGAGAMAAGDNETGGDLMAIGLGAALVGSLPPALYFELYRPEDIDLDYDYLKRQTTNNDLVK